MILSKWIKWSLIVISAILLIFFLSIGLWIRLRSTAAVRQLVTTLSHGKYDFVARKIRVDPFHLRFNAEKLYLYPHNPGSSNTEFELKADTLSLELAEILELIFKAKLNVNSFKIVNPSLKLRVYEKNTIENKKKIPLHDQIAKVQTVFFKVLQSLQVKKFQLIKGEIAYFPELNVNYGRYYLNNLSLSIENLHLLEKFSYSNSQNMANIHLELSDPTIEYPDPTIKIDLKRLDWNTRTRHFEITGLGFHKAIVSNQDSSGFQLQNIKIDSLNWNKLLTNGAVELKELSAEKGVFSNNDFKIKRRNKDSIKIETNNNLLELIGPIFIKRLNIREFEFTGNTHTARGRETLHIKGDQLGVTGLVINKDLPNKVQLEDLNLKVRAFLENDSSNTFRAGFSEISINRNNLTLKDYYIHSLNKSKLGENKIDVHELQLRDLSIGDLLNGKLKARELVLNDPTVKIVLPAGKKKKNGLEWDELQNKLKQKLDIGLIRINNASVTIMKDHRITPIFHSDSFYAIIASRHIIRSQSLEELFASDNSFSVPKLVLRLPTMQVTMDRASFIDNTLYAEKAKGSTTNGILSFDLYNVKAQDLNITNIVNKKDSGLLRILSIGGGEVTINIPEGPPADKVDNLNSELIRTIYGGPTRYTVKAKDWNMQLKLDSIFMDRLQKVNGVWQWQDYFIKGGNLKIEHPAIKGEIGKFAIGNNAENFLKENHFTIDEPGFMVKASIPSIQMEQEIHSTSQLLEKVRKVAMIQPEIVAVIKSGSREGSDPKKKKTIFPVLQLTDPKISISREEGSSLKNLASLNGGKIHIEKTTIEKGILTTDGIDLELKNISSNQEKFSLEAPAIKLQAGKMQFQKGTPFHTQIKDFNIYGARFEMADSTKHLTAIGINGAIDKGFLFNSSKDSLKRLLTTLPHLTLGTDSLSYSKAGKSFKIYQLQVRSDRKEIAFDSIQWKGTITRDSFFRAAGVQKDFIQLQTGAGLLKGYSMLERGPDTVWTVQQLNLSNVDALLERDKRYPVDSVSFRPLMTGMLLDIPLQFSLDRILLNRTKIRYNEINEKNGKEGSIWFNDISATVRNVKNFDIKPTDSLLITARASLMGKGNLRLTFKESYADSLRGFQMVAGMGKMELKELNPLLFPLFNLKIERGYTDSLWLRVKANDYLAFGKMEMDYHKLKLSLLNEGGKKKGFTSFLINFLLKSNNDKTGLVYRERMRNKSMFNYWGKIALSGLLTNMGVQKNKKQAKKFEKEMKSLNLPLDLLDD